MSRIPTRIEPSLRAARRTPAEVRRAFSELLAAGARMHVVGEARRDPARLLARYAPRHQLALFDTRFFLAAARQNPWVRFFVAYVAQRPPGRPGAAPVIHPRIFYKDVSLVWRSASHVTRLGGDLWIGKGDVTLGITEEGEVEYSNEASTDLPLELQTALEACMLAAPRIVRDDRALELVLRRAPDGRIAPYRDFTGPRRRAQADRRNLVYGGRSVARFTRRGDPASLRFAAGFEPDFARGILEVSRSTSRLYGGALRRFRILSRNRRAQYLFFAGPRQVWIASLQATTTELSSYGVRTVDVVADEDLCLPGYEYHFMDASFDPPRLYTQIPPGFAGETSPVDELRADASAWLERVPVIQEFRRRVLSRRRAETRARRRERSRGPAKRTTREGRGRPRARRAAPPARGRRSSTSSRARRVRRRPNFRWTTARCAPPRPPRRPAPPGRPASSRASGSRT